MTNPGSAIASSSNGPIKVFVVEDEGLLRELLARSLDEIEGIEVVGAASEGNSALDYITAHKVDVILMDLLLGDGPNGIDVGIKAQGIDPGLKIIIITSAPRLDGGLSIFQKIGPGWSILSKRNVLGASGLERIIKGAAEGMSTFDPDLFGSAPWRTAAQGPILSQKQTEVLTRVASGIGNDGVASILGISRRSVEAHLQQIYRDLEPIRDPDMNPRVHAVLWFLRLDSARSREAAPRHPGP